VQYIRNGQNGARLDQDFTTASINQSINQFICQIDIRQSKYNKQCMVAGQQAGLA